MEKRKKIQLPYAISCWTEIMRMYVPRARGVLWEVHPIHGPAYKETLPGPLNSKALPDMGIVEYSGSHLAAQFSIRGYGGL